MFLLKDMSLKNIAKTGIGFLSTLFAFLSIFVFSLVDSEWMREGITAVKWLFDSDRYMSWDISGFGTFLVIPAILFAVAAGGLFLLTFVRASSKNEYSNGMRLVAIISAISIFIFMIAGFIITGGFADKFYLDEYTTCMIIPFIISVVLAGGYFGVDMFL
jgi:hypothetical protein